MLAAGEYEADCACTTNGRLCQWPSELRPSQEFIRPRAYQQSASFLAPFFCKQAITGGIQSLRKECPRFFDERGGDDCSRNKNVKPRKDNPRQSHIAARALTGIVPLWWGCGLCGRYCVGGNWRRAVCRNGCSLCGRPVALHVFMKNSSDTGVNHHFSGKSV